MLQIIGFQLAALLVAIGGLAYAIANRNESHIRDWATNFFGVCGIAAMIFAAWLIFQGTAVADLLPVRP